MARAVAILASYSCLYPLVMGLSPAKDGRLVVRMGDEKKRMRDEWGMEKMDNDDGEMVNI